MESPTFTQIWTSEGWLEYWSDNRPVKNQTYYQFRSVVRMAVWIPFFVGCFYIYVGAVAVFS